MVCSCSLNGYWYTSINSLPLEVTNINESAGSGASQKEMESTLLPSPSTSNSISSVAISTVPKGWSTIEPAVDVGFGAAVGVSVETGLTVSVGRWVGTTGGT